MSAPVPVPKVFCVGFNKTGTMTLHALFAEQLGLRAVHDPAWSDWSITRNTARLDRFDAFTDGECPSIGILDALYPDARFILNTRPLRKWVLSRHKAVERSRAGVRWALTEYLPLGWLAGVINRRYLDNGAAAMMRWVAVRNAYHAHVIRYFEGRPHKLLVVNIEDAGGLQRIATFLGMDVQVSTCHAHADGQGSVTAAVLDAIGAQAGTGASERSTDAFFERHLRDACDTLTTSAACPFSLSRSGSDRLLRYLPFLRRLVRAGYVRMVAWRARAHSHFAKWFLDAFIGFLRSEEDLNFFITVQRMGSASR